MEFDQNIAEVIVRLALYCVLAYAFRLVAKGGDKLNSQVKHLIVANDALRKDGLRDKADLVAIGALVSDGRLMSHRSSVAENENMKLILSTVHHTIKQGRIREEVARGNLRVNSVMFAP